MKSSQAQAAKAIKSELRAAFPGVKFSVCSEGFSMGDAVRVEWTDGPTEERVKEITGKYQYGHFDGMQDMYEYSNCREDIPQTKYLSTTRKASERTERFLKMWVQKNFSMSHCGSEWEKTMEKQRIYYGEFAKFHYPEKMWENAPA